MIIFQGGKITCEGRDDAEEFSDIRAAMKVLEMTDQDIWDVLKILASILHMGNIKYDGGDPNEAASIPEQNNVERVAAILGVDKAQFIKYVFHLEMFNLQFYCFLQSSDP